MLSSTEKELAKKLLKKAEYFHQQSVISHSLKQVEKGNSFQFKKEEVLKQVDRITDEAYGVKKPELTLEKLKNVRVESDQTSINNFNKHWEGHDIADLYKGCNELIDSYIPNTNGRNVSDKRFFCDSDGTIRVHMSEDSASTDEFGFSQPKHFQISRVIRPDGSVYHSSFGCSETLRNTDFARKLMSNFYDKYKELGVKKISVQANSQTQSEVLTGVSVWGNWGFSASESDVKRMRENFIRYVVKSNDSGSIKPTLIARGFCEHKVGEKPEIKYISKDGVVKTADLSGDTFQDELDYQDSDTYVPSEEDSFNYKVTRIGDSKQVGDKIKFKYEIYFHPTEHQLDKINNSVSTIELDKVGDRYMLKSLAKKLNKHEQNVFFKNSGSSWDGELDLTNDIQRKTFEKLLSKEKLNLD
jgi:hypothetical protein